MSYLSKEYIDFFTQLEKNNNKEWFDENRETYEQFVKKPFHSLVQDILNEINALDPDIYMVPKDAIFRINRDIRFSKDKTPYNIIMKAGFAKGGRKSPYAGYYLGISAEHIHVGGGVYMLDKDNLKKIRNQIASDVDGFLKIINDKTYKNHFDSIQGEQVKRIPKEFQEVANSVPQIANKQFYSMSKYDTAEYLDDAKLYRLIFEHFKAMTPLNQFMKEGIDN